jgi:hypothetical protein
MSGERGKAGLLIRSGSERRLSAFLLHRENNNRGVRPRAGGPRFRSAHHRGISQLAVLVRSIKIRLKTAVNAILGPTSALFTTALTTVPQCTELVKSPTTASVCGFK